jgi:uncharacterized phage protein gp47/JayE
MTTLAPQISSTGISAPSYADVFAQLQNAYWSIYGTDAQLSADTQDGQFLAILAQAIADNNSAIIAVFNAFNLNYAQGAGQSSLVKLLGIRRNIATNSQAPVTVVGQAGTVILGGVVGDNLNLGTQWNLPPSVTIPNSGTIAVTATCSELGAVAAALGTLTVILTPQNGWQTVTNSAAATLGSPIETDSALRQRSGQSTALPAETILESIYGNVANVAGVTRLAIYENDLDIDDANGAPGHSIYIVALGGSIADITAAIAATKSPGTSTYGTTSAVVIDQNGVPDTINFFILTVVQITVDITIKQLNGYNSTIGANIQAAVAGYISGLAIGEKDYLNRLYAPANLSGDAAVAATGLTQPQLDAQSATFNIVSILQSRPSDAPPAVQDVPIAFNEAAVCLVANITLILT